MLAYTILRIKQEFGVEYGQYGLQTNIDKQYLLSADVIDTTNHK